jgi:hypothetical protein
MISGILTYVRICGVKYTDSGKVKKPPYRRRKSMKHFRHSPWGLEWLFLSVCCGDRLLFNFLMTRFASSLLWISFYM